MTTGIKWTLSSLISGNLINPGHFVISGNCPAYRWNSLVASLVYFFSSVFFPPHSNVPFLWWNQCPKRMSLFFALVIIPIHPYLFPNPIHYSPLLFLLLYSFGISLVPSPSVNFQVKFRKPEWHMKIIHFLPQFFFSSLYYVNCIWLLFSLLELLILLIFVTYIVSPYIIWYFPYNDFQPWIFYIKKIHWYPINLIKKILKRKSTILEYLCCF